MLTQTAVINISIYPILKYYSIKHTHVPEAAYG